MNERHTIQAELVYNAVSSLKCHATADEVYEYVSREHPHISRTTVYRNLQKLSDSGTILKIETPGGADHYDHNVFRHYHAKCNGCGRVFDVDMDYIPDITERIKSTNGFEITSHDIVFKGVCNHCRKETKS